MSNLSEQFQAGVIGVRHIDYHPSNIGRELGDLRDLTNSIRTNGIRVPVVLEKHRGRYRLRDGHRRVAAARLAGVTAIPAVIHAEALDECEWLLEAIDYNTRRKGYTHEDQRRVALQLVDLGVDRRGIAAAFGIGGGALRTLLDGPAERTPRAPRRRSILGRRTLRDRLVAWQQDDADRDTILEELALLVDDVDDSVVERCLAGDQVAANPAERLEVARRWQAAGRSLKSLNDIQGWTPSARSPSGGVVRWPVQAEEPAARLGHRVDVPKARWRGLSHPFLPRPVHRVFPSHHQSRLELRQTYSLAECERGRRIVQVRLGSGSRLLHLSTLMPRKVVHGPRVEKFQVHDALGTNLHGAARGGSSEGVAVHQLDGHFESPMPRAHISHHDDRRPPGARPPFPDPADRAPGVQRYLQGTLGEPVLSPRSTSSAHGACRGHDGHHHGDHRQNQRNQSELRRVHSSRSYRRPNRVDRRPL